MRLATSALLTLCLCVSAGFTGEKTADKPLPPEKWNASYVETQYGLKLKSVKYMISGVTANVTFLFEFTKDADDVKSVQQAFGIQPGQRPSTPTFMLYFFDDENVVTKTMFPRVDTSIVITGKKGDAFRIGLELHSSILHKASKVEFRSTQAPPK